MTRIVQSNGQSGALFDMSGVVPTNATWEEDIYFTENGAAMPLTGLAFRLTLRADSESDSADITLSTAAGTLQIVDDDDGNDRVLRINVTAGTLNSYVGDFTADLASQDGDGKVMHWAHGVITLRPNPVSF